MNVHEISFFMQHNVICLNEGKMYRTFHKYRNSFLGQVVYTLILILRAFTDHA